MRVLQAGIGGMGRRWADVLTRSPLVEFVGAVDPSENAREWARTSLHLPPESLFSSLQQAIAATDADAIVLVTPENTHFELVREALDTGKHVLVEKPMAASLDEAKKLIQVARRKHRILMVAQQYRFRRPARTVQKLISEGTVGEVLGIRAVCRRNTRNLWPDNRYRLEVRHPYLLGMAIHHFDLLRMFTGREVERVYCRGWSVPDSPYRHEPIVFALMELPGRGTFAYEGDWACAGRETSWDGDWEIVGDKGRITWTSEEGRAQQAVKLQQGTATPYEIPLVELLHTEQDALLSDLRAGIESGSDPETSASDNIRSLALVEACIRSMETNKLVSPAKLLAGSAIE